MGKVLLILVVLSSGPSLFAEKITIDKVRAGIGYKLHAVCSGLFHQNLSIERINKNLAALDPILSKIPVIVDRKNKRVSFLKFKETYYRPGFGCIMRQSPAQFRIKTPDVKSNIVDKPLKRVPHSDFSQLGIDSQVLSSVVDSYMTEESTALKNGHTRAIIVAYKNQIVAEKYMRDFDAQSKNISWSVAKSVTAVLAGVAIEKGLVAADQEMPSELKKLAGQDLRGQTLDDLLQMKAGLAFDEDYDNYSSDVYKMLLTKNNMAKFVIRKPMINAPGALLNYSTGTTQLVSAFLRYSIGDDDKYLKFPAESLFAPLGMKSFEFTLDQSGTLVGGAWLYLTAEDWTKFGILMENKGVGADGTTVLSESTFDWLIEPVNEEKTRSRHFHINLTKGKWADLPEDAFAAMGHFNQLILAIPSKDLVIVRLGLTTEGGFDLNSLGRDVLGAFK